MRDMDVRPDSLTDYYVRKYPLTFTDDSLLAEPFPIERYREAWIVAKTASNLLKDRYSASKVVAFGSLVDRSRFNLWSDIDLAVYGVPDRKFYAAVGEVTGLSTKFKIDLVDPGSCRESLRRAIKDEGVEI